MLLAVNCILTRNIQLKNTKMTVVKYLTSEKEYLVSEILITLVRELLMFYDNTCKQYKDKHKKDKKMEGIEDCSFPEHWSGH